MTEDQIEAMARRFLRWPLPEDFAPDCGISFTHVGSNPSGTNLFDYMQAVAMVRHMIGGVSEAECQE